MERPASRTYRLAHAALLAVLVALPSLPSTAAAQAAKPPAAKEEESPTQRLWNEAETALGKKQYKAAFDLFKKLEGESDKAGIQIIDDVDLVNVTEAHLAYFDAIGAVGPVADEM
jgi:outer membrane protein assembly factor BamD (BamD/ComL family)